MCYKKCYPPGCKKKNFIQGSFLTLQSVIAPPSIKMTTWMIGLLRGAKSPWGAFPLTPLDTLIISTYTALTPALENRNHVSRSSYLCCYNLQLGRNEGMGEPR